jgi:hypothetical protein
MYNEHVCKKSTNSQILVVFLSKIQSCVFSGVLSGERSKQIPFCIYHTHIVHDYVISYVQLRMTAV